MPSPLVLLDWGSMSITSTWAPRSASAAPRFITVVVLPTPPFWLATAMIRGVDINMLGLTWGNSTTCRVTAWLPILLGSPQAAKLAGKESAHPYDDQPGLDRDRREQQETANAEADSDQGVVGDVADHRHRAVGELPQEPQADGQDEDRRSVHRRAD